MAAKGCKLICLLIFFAFVAQGYGCDVHRLTLTQSKTGKMVKNKPEWEVRVTDPCTCSFLDVKLSCTGFESAIIINKSVLLKTGDECILNDGRPIHYGDYVFKYVWDTSFDFKITDATIACS
ncbi:unnamed protein product [Thlaspi arvense]|uniref:Uncharacterized protein n=1 Tax=Thlaspi arvense TaxID=13288 RepID=A0AAU9RLU3_THLAR|nr:unnamed protein product [Thlaspi arvense]